MLYSVTEVSVHPEAIGDYEALLTALVPAVADRQPDLSWSVFEVGPSGPGRYRIVIPAPDWRAVGALTRLESAMGAFPPEELEKLERQVMGCYRELRQYVVRPRPDLSCAGGPTLSTPLIELTELHTRPDKQVRVEDYLASLVDAVGRTGDKRRFVVTETVAGQVAGFTMASGFTSPTQLEDARSPAELLVDAFGPGRGSRLREACLEGLAGGRQYVAVHRPELSRLG